jgi:RecB family exonuclease
VDENVKDYFGLFEKLVRSELKRLDDLRTKTEEAVKLAHADLGKRLQDFPQEFARKTEFDDSLRVLQRLEKEVPSAEKIDALDKAIQKLDREALPESVFQTFVTAQRDKDEEAARERRAVASALATSTERRSVIEDTKSATWRQIAGIVTIGITILSFVILLANNRIG